MNVPTFYQVRMVGNFWGGVYYEIGIDSICVLAYSEQDAINIAKENINEVENHFRNKRYRCGKRAISKNDTYKLTEKNVGRASISKMRSYNKTLTKSGKFIPVKIEIK